MYIHILKKQMPNNEVIDDFNVFLVIHIPKGHPCWTHQLYNESY